jgi:hypothetical protein
MALFVFGELILFYLYSLLWLADGQPENEGNSTINNLAIVCFAAAVMWPTLLVVWWVLSQRSLRRQGR